MKKIILRLFILMFILVAIVAGFRTYHAQKINSLKKKYPHKNFNINRELTSNDGYLKVKIHKIESNYKGIDLYYDLELSDEIKEKGFKIQSNGHFSLLVNPKGEVEYPQVKGIPGNPPNINISENQEFNKIRFKRDKLKYDKNDLIRIYFTGATLAKNINEVIEFDLRDEIKGKEIEIGEVGKYHLEFFEYNEEKRIVQSKSTIESYLKNPIVVEDSFCGYKDAQVYYTKGGIKQTGYESLVTINEIDEEVDEYFHEADKGVIELNTITMDVGEYSKNKPYFEFRFSELE